MNTELQAQIIDCLIEENAKLNKEIEYLEAKAKIDAKTIRRLYDKLWLKIKEARAK